jgi:hypothetical protein
LFILVITVLLQAFNLILAVTRKGMFIVTVKLYFFTYFPWDQAPPKPLTQYTSAFLDLTSKLKFPLTLCYRLMLRVDTLHVI